MFVVDQCRKYEMFRYLLDNDLAQYTYILLINIICIYLSIYLYTVSFSEIFGNAYVQISIMQRNKEYDCNMLYTNK